MKKRLIIVSILIATFACGCAKYTGPTRTFTNAQFNVGFNVPQGWEKADASQIQGAIALYMAPKTENDFQVNLNLIIIKLSKDEQGKNPLELARKELHILNDFKEISTETLATDAGKTCEILIYQFTMQDIAIQGMQVYLTNDKQYCAVLTLTALTQNFEKHKPEFIKCGKSLCFGN